jgi:hypothetical protein
MASESQRLESLSNPTIETLTTMLSTKLIRLQSLSFLHPIVFQFNLLIHDFSPISEFTFTYALIFYFGLEFVVPILLARNKAFFLVVRV